MKERTDVFIAQNGRLVDKGRARGSSRFNDLNHGNIGVTIDPEGSSRFYDIRYFDVLVVYRRDVHRLPDDCKRVGSLFGDKLRQRRE